MDLKIKSILKDNITDETIATYCDVLKKKGVEQWVELSEFEPKQLSPIKMLHAIRMVANARPEQLQPSTPQPSTSYLKSPISVDMLLSSFRVPFEKTPSTIKRKLDQSLPLQPSETREFVRFVCSEISDVTPKASTAAVGRIAVQIMDKYPQEFTDLDGKGEKIHGGCEHLKKCLYDRLRNQIKTPKRQLFVPPDSQDEVSENDLEQMEVIRVDLLNNHSLHQHASDAEGCEVARLMSQTIELRKKHRVTSSNKEMIKLWPCIFASAYLLEGEFNKLTTKRVYIPAETGKRVCDLARMKAKYVKVASIWSAATENQVRVDNSLVAYQVGMYPKIMKILEADDGKIFKVYEVRYFNSYILEEFGLLYYSR